MVRFYHIGGFAKKCNGNMYEFFAICDMQFKKGPTPMLKAEVISHIPYVKYDICKGLRDTANGFWIITHGQQLFPLFTAG